MTRRLMWTFIGLAALAACSAEIAADDPTSTVVTTKAGEGPAGAVLVKATGIVSRGADGTLEICPGRSHDCAGIPLTGDMSQPNTDPPVAQVTGWYDGAELSVTASEVPDLSLYAETDFSTPCGGLRGPVSVNPPHDPVEAISAYTATIPDRLAGMWWDRASAVMTVWLTGDDVALHRQVLEDAVGEDMAVCVVGGADYSEAELIEIQRRVFDVVDTEATAMWATSVGTLANRVEVMMEYLDQPTRALVGSEFGDAVVFYAFLEVVEGTIADLPDQIPVHPGNVELLTQSNRAGGGMEALGTFELRFDEERRCVFFPGDEDGPDGNSRIVPVWPFGYTAESDPLRIYDQDGELVAEEGNVIQMGGGFVEYVAEKELCGAGGAWIMSSRPEIVGP